MNYIFVDFEMQPISKQYKEEKRICKQEIIEIGAVMFDEDNKEISSFKKYVKPEYSTKISSNINYLTGINDGHLYCCKDVETEINAFADWCLSFGNEIKVYAWSENDLNQINSEYELKNLTKSESLETVIDNWNDLQFEYDQAIGATRPTSLKKALESLGFYFEGKTHDALDDSRNTAKIYVELSNPDEFKKSIECIKSYLTPKKSSGSTLGDKFDFAKMAMMLQVG